MLAIESVPEAGRPPWWRTALLMVLGLGCSLISMVFSPAIYALTGDDAGGWSLFVAIVGLPLLGVCTAALAWRDRYPVMLVVILAAISVVMPIGNTLVFIALAALIARRRGGGVLMVAVLVALTSGWVVLADARAQPRDASVLGLLLGPPGSSPDTVVEISVAVVIVVIVLGWALAVGFGWLARTRRLKAATEAAYASAKQETSNLGEDLARRQEREMIAREVHDALGHRLSLLNLHAGAMEANAQGDAKQQESARLIRESAGAAINDLRSLLDLLHAADGASQPVFGLSDLPKVVEESFGVGQQLSSSIFIRDAESAPPQLTNAVYRIVQELLTNARRHATNSPVMLKVNGGPDVGITVETVNPMSERSGITTGGGRGLVGITERTELLGGSVRHGVDGDRFRVEVHLPWTTRPT